MNAMASGTPLAAGEAPAWASVHAEDYVNFRRRLPANQQPDLVSLFHPGVLSTAATQREYLLLLHQLLSSSSSSGGGGRAYHESNAVPPPPRGCSPRRAAWRATHNRRVAETSSRCPCPRP